MTDSKLPADPARVVHVPLSGGRDYRIHINDGALSTLGERCSTVARGRRAVIITQPIIARRWGAVAAQSLADAGFLVDTIVFPAGERHKHPGAIARLYGQLYNLPEAIDRKTLIVALGGGVVGDMAGFVAATYLRGLDYVQAPTTLLAMVDSSVGGKTGVDFREGKNLIGAFHQPRDVTVDPRTLSTLPARHLRSGLAEVIKYAVINDPSLLPQVEKWVEERCADDLASLIARSCSIKAEVVVGDEREENGGRASLNFGHTIGHALESATRYRRYLHGEAVAIGMVSAACIGHALGVGDQQLIETIIAALTRAKLPIALPDDIDDDTLIALTARDKKASGGAARYVLATRIGDVALMAAPEESVREGLHRHRTLGRELGATAGAQERTA